MKAEFSEELGCGMAAFESAAIISRFSDLSDPQQHGKGVDPLVEVLILVLAAAMAGAEAFTEIERFGKVKLPLLRRFSGLGTGTPPHDTLGDNFALDFEAFQNGFAWAAGCALTSTGWSGTRRSRLSRRARSRLCGGNG